MFSPADEEDLGYFLSRVPREIPVTVIGVGSNLIVRDGGVKGVVIRLGGRGFGAIETTADFASSPGAAALDAAGCAHGGRGWDRRPRVPARRARNDRRRAAHERGRAWRRDASDDSFGRAAWTAGRAARFSNAEMGFSYRHSEAPEDVIFTRAVFQGRPGEPEQIRAEMERITLARESLAAHSRKNRRFDLQEPAGAERRGN